MSRVLLDENVPIGLRRLLEGHEATSAEYRGWQGLTNGRLLAAAAIELDVFVTADRNIRFQQHVADLPIAIVMLSSTRWDDIRKSAAIIKLAVDRAEAGAISFVAMPLADV